MQALLDTVSRLNVPTQACRLFHGRGGRYPGCEQWSLDFYPPVWLLTSHGEVSPEDITRFQSVLSLRWSEIAPEHILHCVLQVRHANQTRTQLLSGSVPDPHWVLEGASQYQVQLMRSKNHGLFLDMACGRQWVHKHVHSHPGIAVLNLFAYTGAFSVVALQAGASRVVNVDMSAGAMALAQANHRKNEITKGASFWVHDIFKSWAKIQRAGPFDLVIVDPPSFQKGSFVAHKDYARVLRRLPQLVDNDGYALLCLNAPELGPEFLHQLVQTCARGFTLVQRLNNPAAFDDVASERSLKVLLYQKKVWQC